METVIRHTRHGPVLSDILARTSHDPDSPNEEVLSFQWIAHTTGNEVGLVDGVNRARDWNEFLAGMAHHITPSLNCVYADTRAATSATPWWERCPCVRARSPHGSPWRAGTPTMTGPAPYPSMKLPRLYNPPEGIVATANNRMADPDLPLLPVATWSKPPYRVERIRHLLTHEKRLDLETMARIQLDTRSVQAERLLTALRPE